ncbi:protein SYM1 [Tilletiaria anomala UBC 951]|uniref:Protein SYM1 n=1 Tax=Tilletiaria anomala (strain ATCC 24038 / CBS 436.72 / UBC 951) TaxID=1037660 RepID=A0A066VNM5_TILAU|nr:protein SYM1 [Tilletiaria anomala UBC 951]KDN41878.1 protein SYM1 [Tilletiaria anomala UBC 951]
MSFARFLAATSATLPRQCATAGVLFATGDVIAQQAVERKGKQHDIYRTLRLGAYGGLIFAPIASTWFGKVLERVNTGSKAGNVVTKVALDQSVAAPVFTAVFFSATTIMAGGSQGDVKQKLNESWWTTLKTGWMLWTPVQVINMAFVPVQQRLLFVNVVNLGWNTFLSLMSGSKAQAPLEPIRDEVEYELREVKAHKLA